MMEQRLAQLRGLLVMDQPLESKVIVDVSPIHILIIDIIFPILVVAVRSGEVVVHVECPVSHQTTSLVLRENRDW